MKKLAYKPQDGLTLTDAAAAAENAAPIYCSKLQRVVANESTPGPSTP